MAGLMAVVARLPEGRVVLPGLDLAMPEPVWQQFDDSHPQAGLRALLAGMGAVRGDVGLWPDVQAPSSTRRIRNRPSRRSFSNLKKS